MHREGRPRPWKGRREERQERRRRRQRTGPPSGQKLTVAAAAEKWLETRIAVGRNAHNRRVARARAEMYLKRFMGHLPLQNVTANHLREYRIWLEKLPGVHGREHLSMTTIAYVLGDARNFLYWAEESGLVDRAPFPRRLLPRIQERPPDHLRDDEVRRVLAIPEPRAFVVRLALGTGMRWSELCRAVAADLQDGMLLVHQTKSGKLRRIPLDHVPELLAELGNRVGWLCPYPEDGSGTFSKVVRRRSGVARFHFHQLRHTFAVNWLRRGGSLPVLQQLLGHSTVIMTQRYAKLTDEHVRAEARRLAGGGGK
jgi:integrase